MYHLGPQVSTSKQLILTFDLTLTLSYVYLGASDASCGEILNATSPDSPRPTIRGIARGVISPQALEGAPVAQAVPG